MHCVVGVEHVLNHCRSIVLRKSLWLIQDHHSHSKSPMIVQSSFFIVTILISKKGLNLKVCYTSSEEQRL